jgi:hypothetical protein
MGNMSSRDRHANPACEREIRNYLEKGETPDLPYSNWRGSDWLKRARCADKVLRDSLVAELRQRAGNRKQPPLPPGFNTSSFTRSKLTPMINGLFPPTERETVLALLQDSVVFLNADSIEELLTGRTPGLHTAWNLANIYLGSFGLPPLGGDYECIVGMSEETTCYVTPRYFIEEDPYADFVVHEAAHVFHNWKREYAGLPFTRQREWLLPIEFRKRETFALACEAFSRISDGASGRAERRTRLAEYREHHVPSVAEDPTELLDILAEAVDARNGWKRILERCSYLKRP